MASFSLSNDVRRNNIIANTLSCSNINVNNIDVNNSLTLNVPIIADTIQVADGTLNSPSISFIFDNSIGIYHEFNNMNFANNGIKALQLGSAVASFAGQVLTGNTISVVPANGVATGLSLITTGIPFAKTFSSAGVTGTQPNLAATLNAGTGRLVNINLNGLVNGAAATLTLTNNLISTSNDALYLSPKAFPSLVHVSVATVGSGATITMYNNTGAPIGVLNPLPSIDFFIVQAL